MTRIVIHNHMPVADARLDSMFKRGDRVKMKKPYQDTRLLTKEEIKAIGDWSGTVVEVKNSSGTDFPFRVKFGDGEVRSCNQWMLEAA